MGDCLWDKNSLAIKYTRSLQIVKRENSKRGKGQLGFRDICPWTVLQAQDYHLEFIGMWNLASKRMFWINIDSKVRYGKVRLDNKTGGQGSECLQGIYKRWSH